MVRKLFKHELEYYLRSLVPVYAVLGVVALVGRFIQFFEAETTAYEIMHGSAVVMLVVAGMAAMFLSLLFAVVRFYKNMFSGEGYLTMTLPATPCQHLWVKLATAWLAVLVTFLAVILAVCVFTLGPWLVEIWKAAAFLIDKVVQELNHHFAWYVLEGVILLLVALGAILLTYYGCISLGQLAKKNRVLAAVGVYFALYVITQILATIVIVVLTVTGTMDAITQWFDALGKEQLLQVWHYLIWAGTAWSGLIGGIFFFISRYILSNKLNLE